MDVRVSDQPGISIHGSVLYIRTEIRIREQRTSLRSDSDRRGQDRISRPEPNASPMKLQDKTAIVTGGASGIGLAICERFAREGARVVILDLNEEQMESAVQRLEKEQGSQGAEFHRCDVSDGREVERVVSGLGKPVDILVNNAGVSHIGTLADTTEEEFDRVYRINVKGVYNCSRAVIGGMMERRGGVILNLASIVSHVGIPDRFAYSMSKGAVLTMTYSIACDYLSYNIRCNCIAPARVYTPFVENYLKNHYPGREKEMFDRLSATQPIGRMGQPEEIAGLALYLCSDEASFITGTSFPIDGGFLTLKP